MGSINIDHYIKLITEMAIQYVPKIAGAIIVWIIGSWVIKRIVNFARKRFQASESIDETLAPFFTNMLGTCLKLLLALSTIGILGVETTSFAAIIAAAGLAIGMALQGSLGNFAGGVLLLIFRPFSVGDYIKAQDQEGVVERIQLFVTVLRTLDNRIIYLPNGPLAGGAMENLTEADIRRVDMTFGIGYDDDIDQARSAFKEVLSNIPEVLQSPAPDIIVTELADSSVNFSVRPWCKPEHYWKVYGDAHEAVKKTLDQKGISIPFPQQDLHMHQIAVKS